MEHNVPKATPTPTWRPAAAHPRAPKASSLAAPQPLYDEQVGNTFTQSFTSMDYNVTATSQTDSQTGTGPAYLLNGLSDSGYWYQVGLSWNWDPGYTPGTGFDMFYEVWDSEGHSIYPSNGGGGLYSFSRSVLQGDKVLLSLYFSSNEVVMLVKDYNTGASATQVYETAGGSQFVGLSTVTSNTNGYFTGLMTEWYHGSAFYGNIQAVAYSSQSSGITSEWLWADEFSSPGDALLFTNSTRSPVSFLVSALSQRFSTNGVSEYASAYQLVTGYVDAVPLTIGYSVLGGGTGYSAPALSYTFYGQPGTVSYDVTSPITFYVDSGSAWSLSSELGGSSTTQRWATDQSTSGTASGQSVSLTYYHQFYAQFGYSIEGGGTGYSPPVVTYLQFGAQQTTIASPAWVDSGSAYSFPSLLSGSSSSERWYSVGANGTMSAPETIAPTYNHQFAFTTVGLSATTEWKDAGSQVSLNVEEVFGRSNGTGYRITSATLDDSPPQIFPPTLDPVPVSFTMNSPHKLVFAIVKQYQVTLDKDAIAALSSMTSPTISGDQYWYDAGSPVTVVLNGVWERSSGAGTRLVSYIVNGGIPTLTSTVGTVTSLSISSISSPQSVATIVVSQYELSAPTGSISSVTSPTISGDAGWYDSGTTVTVIYNDIWDTVPQQTRLVATGYSIDGGSVTSVPESGSGTFAIRVTMGSAHAVDLTSVTQYYVSFKFTDGTGSKIITPTDLQISISGRARDVPAFNIFLDNDTVFTVANVSYEGVDVKPTAPTQYSVTGPASITLKDNVYDATIKVSDFLGFAVSGARVQMTLANGTVVSGATGSDGTFVAPSVPLGIFNASVSNLGSTVQITGNSSKQSVTPASVIFGTVSLSLVVVVVVVAVGATIFVLRTRPKGSPAAPAAQQPFRAPAFCPNCGTPVGWSEEFCVNCGSRLRYP